MVGRVRYKKTGDKVKILGQWVPDGSYPSYKDLSQSVCYDRTNPGPPYKSGGSLYIASTSLTWRPSASLQCDNSLWGRYHGRFIPAGVPPTGWWGGGSPPVPGQSGFTNHNGGKWIDSNSEPLESQGATGWNRARPDAPIIDLGQFLGELRNVPSLPGKSALNALGRKTKDAQKRTSAAKAAGDEYLNAEFGWKPLLSDLSKLLSIREELDKRLAQLRRDNGHSGPGVRRNVTLVDVNEVTYSDYETENPFYPYLHPFYHVNGSGRNYVTVTKSRKDWFEAKFRYYIPELAMPGYPGPTAAKLLGLSPSPSLAWELTPWSWLIDYFANVGDVLSNMAGNASSNLVADYAYVMSTVTHRTDVTQMGTILSGTPVKPVPISSSLSYEYSLKRRSYASPFGFGLKPGDLSGRQAAILGALGMSRFF